ncbi:hypothetical protein [Castellaniella sp.]|uniref:hypothetical protein n=1 Tax=Castellaniella sp. TaxID=1955812 RepID=UPI002AFF1F53|nr:hypothetical protein [Castellaniella sp.]
MALKDYLGEQLLGVLASYQHQGIVHHVGVVYPRANNELRVFIPKGHALAVGSLVTLHLDNRTGVDELDAELRVYRTSYKGRVLGIDESWVTLQPVEFMLVHGLRVVEQFREPGYDFPADDRTESDLPITPLRHLGPVQEKEHHNKVGILTTLAVDQPHTTVLAFLNTEADDVFLVSVPGTFKQHQLDRNPHCFFIIDERAKFTFEQAIDWNYTILEMQACQVPASLPLYEQVRTAFVLKNPWEADFFLMDGLEMIHLQCRSMVFAGEPRPIRSGRA